jgi:hypothetical protein
MAAPARPRVGIVGGALRNGARNAASTLLSSWENSTAPQLSGTSAGRPETHGSRFHRGVCKIADRLAARTLHILKQICWEKTATTGFPLVCARGGRTARYHWSFALGPFAFGPFALEFYALRPYALGRFVLGARE